MASGFIYNKDAKVGIKMSKRMMKERRNKEDVEVDILSDLWVSSKRMKTESSSSAVDRLSELPDDILQYILGFLETKDVIKTCVLAKSWKNLWTGVPVLDFNSNSFTKLVAFKKFVRNVLRVRGGKKKNSPVGTVRFNYRETQRDKKLWYRLKDYDKKFMERFFNYVKSHNVHHLSISIHGLCEQRPFPVKLSEYHHQYLETLQLERIDFITEPLKFAKLTSLHLESCNFPASSSDTGTSGSFDVLSCCPNLNKLWLSRCLCDSKVKVLKISGPNLVSLTIYNLFESWEKNAPEVEICAPKVTFFRCKTAGTMDFIKVINLPSLQHADLDVPVPYCEWRTRYTFAKLVNFFEGISNVQSLTLSASTIAALAEVPRLEQRPTPFRRLKWWKLIPYAFNYRSFLIPERVSTYLFRYCKQSCLVSAS